MNPFQLPLELGELLKVEDLNPDIVGGLDDINQSLDLTDKQVVSQLEEKIGLTENFLGSLDQFGIIGPNRCLKLAEGFIGDCDDNIKCQLYGICDDITQTTGDICVNCEGQASPTQSLIDSLRDTEDITYFKAPGRLFLGGTIKSRDQNWCTWVVQVAYCLIRKPEGFHWISSNIFDFFVNEDAQGKLISVTNCKNGSFSVGQATDFGLRDGNLDDVFIQGLTFLKGVAVRGDVTCGIGVSQPTPTQPPPIAGPLLPPGTGEPKPKDCPAPIIKVQPCPSPPINVTVNPIINIDQVVTQSQSQTQAQTQTQVAIPGQTQPTEPLSCPDKNELEEMVTICGESRMIEFMDRQGILPLIPTFSLGEYIKTRLVNENNPQPVEEFRS